MAIPALEARASVVFDLDGTLVDSVPDVAAALNRMLAEFDRPALTLDGVRALVGHGARYMIEGAFAATGEEAAAGQVEAAVDMFIERYRARPVEKTVVYPTAEEALKALLSAGLRLGICSNKPYEMVLVVLGELGLGDLFCGVTGGDNVTYPKPDGRHLLETLSLMETPAHSSVFVGDSRSDFLAARDAGVPSIGVNYGYAKDESEREMADFRIDSLSEVVDLVIPPA